MRQYTGRREYVEQFETFIYRDECEIPINCTLSVYQGTHADDDPGEIIVESAIVAEDNSGQFKKGTILDLTHEEQETIQERYFITQ